MRKTMVMMMMMMVRQHLREGECEGRTVHVQVFHSLSGRERITATNNM